MTHKAPKTHRSESRSLFSSVIRGIVSRRSSLICYNRVTTGRSVAPSVFNERPGHKDECLVEPLKSLIPHSSHSATINGIHERNTCYRRRLCRRGQIHQVSFLLRNANNKAHMTPGCSIHRVSPLCRALFMTNTFPDVGCSPIGSR